MRFWGYAAALHIALVTAAFAEDVEVTFTLPPDSTGLAVSWSATPLDLPPDADILAAMVMQPDAVAGPWQVRLAPGAYQVSAFSDTTLFELIVTIIPGTPQAYEVPPLDVAQGVAFRCEDMDTCAFTDDRTGLSFLLPKGWAAEQPYRYDLGDGTLAREVSAVFFEDVDGEGASVWFLNPTDWVEDENGPCRTIALGAMCSFDESDAAERAFGVIAPSLRLAGTP